MKNGQEIIFKRYTNQNILIGDVLLFKHPFIKNKSLVKRVTNITKRIDAIDIELKKELR